MNICRSYSKSEDEIHDNRGNTALRVKKSTTQLWYSEHLPKLATMKMQINHKLSKEITMENAVHNTEICLQIILSAI